MYYANPCFSNMSMNMKCCISIARKLMLFKYVGENELLYTVFTLGFIDRHRKGRAEIEREITLDSTLPLQGQMRILPSITRSNYVTHKRDRPIDLQYPIKSNEPPCDLAKRHRVV